MELFTFEWNGHKWVYVYRQSNVVQLVHQVYKDSRRPECGFTLWQVLEAIRRTQG